MNLFFVTPFFSNTQFLEDALRSLVAQTYPNWKAVVLDDSISPAEAAGAAAVVKKLNDPRIEYIKNPTNLGLAKNWNQGLDLGMNYDGITLLHADDILAPDYARSIAEAYKAYPEATAFFTKSQVIDEKGQKKFSFPDWYKTTLLPSGDTIVLKGAEGIKALIPGNFIFCPSICFISKKLQQERFGENLKQVPDFDLTLRLLLKDAAFVGLYQKPLYLYRRHGNNTTNLHNRSLLRFHEERDLYYKLSSQLEARGLTKLAQEAKKIRVIKLNLIFNFVKSLLSGQISSAWIFLRFLFQLK